MNTYLLIKFVHVAAVVVWLGGAITLTVLNLLVLREADRAFLATLSRHSIFIGMRVMSPAAGVVLLTGFAAVGVGHLGFPLWVLWGIAAMVAVMWMGGAFIRKAGMELGRLLSRPDADNAAIAAAQRRMAKLQLIMILLLLSAVWAMVGKPTW